MCFVGMRDFAKGHIFNFGAEILSSELIAGRRWRVNQFVDKEGWLQEASA
jgi:hypothetical protein